MEGSYEDHNEDGESLASGSRYDNDPDFVAPPGMSLSMRSSPPAQPDLTEREYDNIQLKSYPWAAWAGCACVAGLPWLLFLVFAFSVSLLILSSVVTCLALALACYPDWVIVSIEGSSGLFRLVKTSPYRRIFKTTITETFPLQDIRSVQVVWLGENEMRRHQQARRKPCCHSYKTSIQASTMLIVVVTSSSAFQAHNRPVTNDAELSETALSGTDITPTSNGRLKIAIREIQDLLGLERWAVESLYQWEHSIREALQLDLVVR
ncbi:MAG: hypothetical protein Q8P67_21440 [archaeon]|nr:hypothetical protein [archaeon]